MYKIAWFIQSLTLWASQEPKNRKWNLQKYRTFVISSMDENYRTHEQLLRYKLAKNWKHSVFLGCQNSGFQMRVQNWYWKTQKLRSWNSGLLWQAHWVRQPLNRRCGFYLSLIKVIGHTMLRLDATQKKRWIGFDFRFKKFRIKQAIFISDIFPSRVKASKQKKIWSFFSLFFSGFCSF